MSDVGCLYCLKVFAQVVQGRAFRGLIGVVQSVIILPDWYMEQSEDLELNLEQLFHNIV